MSTNRSGISNWSGTRSAGLVPVVISSVLAMGSVQAQALDQVSSHNAGVMTSEIRSQADDRIEIQASKEPNAAKTRQAKAPSAIPAVSPPRPAVDRAKKPAAAAPAHTRLPAPRRISISKPNAQPLPRARDPRLLDIRNPAANPQLEIDLGDLWTDANDVGVIRAMSNRVGKQGERVREALAEIIALF